MSDIPWAEGRWTHEPVRVEVVGDSLVVQAAEGSDAWRHTSYGFVHDSEHALIASLNVGEAMEVEFDAAFTEQFDQAGIFVHASSTRWVKAGVEFADGALQVGAVVTDGMSDWSVAAVPQWVGTTVRVRVSRAHDALTVRAAGGDEPWRLVRVIPFPGALAAQAGPFTCAPTRAGLEVAFRAWRRVAADSDLH